MILNELYIETMKLEALTKIIQPLTVKGSTFEEVQGITYDSRKVRPGYLFVALRGEHENGLLYVSDAIARGAVAVVTESPQALPIHVSHIQVADARSALAEMSCAYFDSPSRSMQMIGVTGTNGKTTTSFLIKSILEQDGRVPGLIGTVRHEIGQRCIPAVRTTPEAPEVQSMLDQMRKAGCRSAVMEVSSHALAQKRVWGIDFDVAVFTNLTPEHLDYHQNMQQYFSAKAMLFSGLGLQEKRAVAVINIDDAWGQQLAGICDTRVQEITFGFHPAAQVRAEHLESDMHGSRFDVATPWGAAHVDLPLLGRFNVSNALAAIAACGALGIDPVKSAGVLARIGVIPGRLESIPNSRGIQIFVDYAHSSDALDNVLRTLREVAPKRIITVFGCGGNRDKAKRFAMGAVAAEYADYTVITTDNPRDEDPSVIAREIARGFGTKKNFDIVLDRTDAIARGISCSERGDFLLIAGKGHESYQEFAHTVVPFDDRMVVRRLAE
ncbi:MAG: UDP-N-acetylmuramoyl-L-alanyl-D-glutamate--2,6-diaminopimelate ligase [Spartobacteria bacterium]|nr:UDP-N-acetylmuramoyl-L-alanyl-D-glutamate--2,6-diaminopimelate ligase [Spartobacteria bacterium]